MTAPILLLSCYELGHQPVSLGWPLAILRGAGLEAAALDLSLEELAAEHVAAARLIAIAVPMHTALRLGVEAAHRVRAINPDAHLCFYGLYAWLNRDFLLQGPNALGDSVLAGEGEPTLLALAQAVLANDDVTTIAGVTTATQAARPVLSRISLPQPDRSTLPALDRYARYMENGVAHLAGYTEASRGCLHTCRHCPVVPIYGGRFFVVPAESVLNDVRGQVEAGARHITFGDPDFLNGPGHAHKLITTLHSEFPDLTFDFTTKVEHILEHPDLMLEFGGCGVTFVVSAFEAVSARVLTRLHKGHTRADMEAALAVLRRAGIAPQPTWMPFTPWTSLEDYIDLLAWIRAHDLIAYVPAVQLSIRMLVPPSSALLDDPESAAWLGELDAENFSYRWAHPDPRMDALYRQVAAIAEHMAEDNGAAFAHIETAAYAIAGRIMPMIEPVPMLAVPPPRLTEHWFC